MSDDAHANEDLKAKMREALERKAERSHPHEQAVEPDGSERMHGVEGHVDTQSYRRKAGGGGA